MFEQPDELAETLVELPDQKAIEAYAVLEQPDEGSAIHHGKSRIAQRYHVVAPRLVLEHGPLAEPGAGGQAGKARGLAAARHDAHPSKAGDNPSPVLEGIAAHED